MARSPYEYDYDFHHRLYVGGFRLYYKVAAPGGETGYTPLVARDAYGSPTEKANEAAAKRAWQVLKIEFQIGEWTGHPRSGAMLTVNWRTGDLLLDGKPTGIVALDLPKKPRAKKAKSNPRRRR